MSVSVIKFTTTVAGNASQFIVLENTSKKQRLHLDAISILVTADASVANRYVRLRVYNAEGWLTGNIHSSVTTASQTAWHIFTRACSDSISNNSITTYHLPKLWLDPFEKLKFDLNGGVAGDSVIIYVQGYTEKVAFSN